VLIGARHIGQGRPAFLVAEAAFNHNGDLDRALAMVHAAAKAGCDAVKFQTYRTEQFCQPADPMFHHFKRGELEPAAWPLLKAECERHRIVFLSTPQNRSDLDILLKAAIPAIKVGSDDFTNLPLLMDYASVGLPMILSCGMADMNDVYRALASVGALEGGRETALLVCTSQYPAPVEEANVARITTLRAAFPRVEIGFSDHTEGAQAAIAAAALGATVFEKHFTLDRNLPGPDHWYAETPESLREWVSGIRTTRALLGSGLVVPTEKELANKLKYQRRAGQQLRGHGVVS
jgi:N,N'-diacetyllegionaminate synthase